MDRHSAPAPAGGKDASLQDPDTLCKTLGADLQRGLTAQEAASRLANNGPNELLAVPQVPVWRRLLSHFQDPLIYLLMAAIGVALAAWVVEGRHGWPVDATVIGLIVVLNGILGCFSALQKRKFGLRC